jgi:hypothetical protein
MIKAIVRRDFLFLYYRVYLREFDFCHRHQLYLNCAKRSYLFCHCLQEEYKVMLD